MAAGDIDAAATFVRRFKARVYGLALAVVGAAPDAEEVVQEAFVRAWRHAGNFDPRRFRVSTWLLTITRNVAIDMLRVRRDLPVDPAAVAEMLVGGVDDIDRQSESDHIAAAFAVDPEGPGRRGGAGGALRPDRTRNQRTAGNPAWDRQDPDPDRTRQTAIETGGEP